MVDYGTGTGVVGLVAIKAGARKVHFVDRSLQAITCTKENVLLNSFGDQSVVHHSSSLPDINHANVIIYASPYLDFQASRAARKRYGPLIWSMFDPNDESKLRLIEDATSVLSEGGLLVLQFGSISNTQRIYATAEKFGFQPISCDEYPHGAEQSYIVAFLMRSKDSKSQGGGVDS